MICFPNSTFAFPLLLPQLPPVVGNLPVPGVSLLQVIFRICREVFENPSNQFMLLMMMDDDDDSTIFSQWSLVRVVLVRVALLLSRVWNQHYLVLQTVNITLHSWGYLCHRQAKCQFFTHTQTFQPKKTNLALELFLNSQNFSCDIREAIIPPKKDVP